MAFALTGIKAFGVRAEGASQRKHAMQVAILYITGTAADVALDIGTDAGTFWTAATGDAKYGALATLALKQLKAALTQCNALLEVEAGALLSRIPVAALGGPGQYTLSVSNKRPVITLNAGDGDTSYIIALRWDLKDNLEAAVIDLGAAQ